MASCNLILVRSMRLLVTLLLTVLASFSRISAAGDYDAGTTGIELPETAKKLLLEKLGATQIRGIDQLVFRRLRDADYLGIEGGFVVSWWWESAFLHDFVLRKKVSDPDWSKAELFDPKLPVCALLADPGDVDSFLSPWKRPNQALQPTASPHE